MREIRDYCILIPGSQGSRIRIYFRTSSEIPKHLRKLLWIKASAKCHEGKCRKGSYVHQQNVMDKNKSIGTQTYVCPTKHVLGKIIRERCPEFQVKQGKSEKPCMLSREGQETDDIVYAEKL